MKQLTIVLSLAVLITMLLATMAEPGLRPTGSSVSRLIADVSGKILTVNGPISPDQLGVTMMHEHIFVRSDNPSVPVSVDATEVEFYYSPLTVDMLGAVIMGYRNKDNLILGDEKIAFESVMDYKMQGGHSIVEVTSIGRSRDPLALRRVARATDVNIIMGTSWPTKDWYRPEMDERSIESLTEEIVRDITVGVGLTGVRSGIIGEVGTVGNPLTPLEIKVIRASGRASRLTGAAVSIHTSAYAGINEQHRILNLLEGEGADLRRVILGHSDSLVRNMPFLKELLDRGVYVGFYRLGDFPMLRDRVTDAHVAEGILELIQSGYLNQILLSQSVDRKSALKAFGGTGYSFVLELFVPHLRRLGATDEQIETILVENPKRVLSFASPFPAEEPRMD